MEFFGLSHAIYTTAIKVRGFTCQQRGRNMHSRAGASVIRRLVSLDRQQHAEIASYHRARALKLKAIWSLVVDRAANELFGRRLEFGEYKVCAIARPEFPEKHKRVLRHCAYRATEHLDCAAAHEILARRG